MSAPGASVADAAGLEVRRAVLETQHGPVEVHGYRWPDEQPYVVLRHQMYADPVRLRVQGQCLTSTAFGSQMCDCREQIDAGVRMAACCPGSVFVYLPQEGHGYGLLSKIEVMAAMNAGRSLPDAQRHLGRPDSRLSYVRVPEILAHLGHTEGVMVVTDNPVKEQALRATGIRVIATEALAL
jgi:GTP cyclohydrolase II